VKERKCDGNGVEALQADFAERYNRNTFKLPSSLVGQHVDCCIYTLLYRPGQNCAPPLRISHASNWYSIQQYKVAAALPVPQMFTTFAFQLSKTAT
jgi:hypothetical protein